MFLKFGGFMQQGGVWFHIELDTKELNAVIEALSKVPEQAELHKKFVEARDMELIKAKDQLIAALKP